MSKKLLTIQDISCYGQCSITAALPTLSAYGVETAILPSAILSTYTSGFTNYTFLDLTDEMPKIINHWISEGIKFDCIYTGYIGNSRQFDYILKCKEYLLKDDGLFIVDPAMADHGRMYKGLGEDILNGMKRICSVADYILTNITEASFLTGNDYNNHTDEKLLKDLYALGAKNVILTGVEKENQIGASSYDGKSIVTVLKEKQPRSYHGTGDLFSSIVIAKILSKANMEETLSAACDFVIDSIKATVDDDNHKYGVKFEDVLNKRR